jgi:hemoglobin-like flavoprotein
MDYDGNTQRLHDHRLLQASLTLIAPVADDVISAFYDQLFQDYPQVRSMFPAVMDAQRERLLKAIIALVTHYDQPEQLMPALTAMGRRHGDYGVRPEHFDAVGATLLATLSSFAGTAWTPEVETAWIRAYTFAAETMMSAAETMMNAGNAAGSDIEMAA